jgi:hypothetical protein
MQHDFVKTETKMSDLLEMIPRPPVISLIYFCVVFALFALIMFRWAITRWWALGLCLIVSVYVVAYVIKAQMGEERIDAFCGLTKPGEPIEQVAQRAIKMKLPVRRNEAVQRWVKYTITRLDVVDGRSSCELEHDGTVWRSRLQRAPGGGDQQLVSYCEETKPDEPVELTLQRAIDSKLTVARTDRKALVRENQENGWEEERRPAYLWVGMDGWILSACDVEHDGERATKVSFYLWYQ